MDPYERAILVLRLIHMLKRLRAITIPTWNSFDEDLYVDNFYKRRGAISRI